MTVNRSPEHSIGTLLNSGSLLVVINCSQDKKYGAPFSKLSTGEQNWGSNDLRIRELVHYCSQEPCDRTLTSERASLGNKQPR